MPPNKEDRQDTAAASRTGALSLDETIAVCEELAALDRAGLPLVPALRQSSRDVSRRLDRVRAELAELLASGRSLSEVAGAMLAGRSRGRGALDKALEAGLRAARPADALETYVRTARQLALARSIIARASVYPIFVMLLACGVFWLTSRLVAPQLVMMYQDLGLSLPWFLATIATHATLITLLAVVFVALLIVWLSLWWWTGAVVGAPPGWLSVPMGIVPGWGRFVRAANRACAVRLFGVMLECGVPLDECLEQAASLAGSRRDRQWAERAVAALRAGTSPAEALAGGPLLPASVVWWLSGNQPAAEIGRRIRSFSDDEFARLGHRAQIMQSVGPALATVAVGATAGACYGLSMFSPLYSLIELMARPF